MRSRSGLYNILLNTLLTLVSIACFPANPLVLTGILEIESYTVPFAAGCITWLFGIILVASPVIMFRKHGGVPIKKSFVHTTKIVTTGIYGVVRHPQYTGGVYSIFLTTLLWYPHLIFAMLGLFGTALIYVSCREEDKLLTAKFGTDYVAYMGRVPRMNIFLGILRKLRSNSRKW